MLRNKMLTNPSQAPREVVLPCQEPRGHPLPCRKPSAWPPPPLPSLGRKPYTQLWSVRAEDSEGHVGWSEALSSSEMRLRLWGLGQKASDTPPPWAGGSVRPNPSCQRSGTLMGVG